MYDDLVKRLRELHPEEFGDAWDFAFACQQAMHEAADAIEELSRLHEAQRQNLIALMNEGPEIEWISVEDRLPEHQDEYLVLWRDRSGSVRRLFYEILEYEGNGNWADDIPQSEPFGGFDVLYWMELPRMPEEAKDG